MSKKTATNFLANYIHFPKVQSPIIASFIKEKITIPNPDQFHRKFTNIRNNSKQLEFISDFDYTITKYRHEGKQCDSLFGMWTKGDFLPKKFVTAIINNYRQYFNIYLGLDLMKLMAQYLLKKDCTWLDNFIGSKLKHSKSFE